MAYNANEIGLELHGNFYIYTNKLDRLIRKKGKQEVLEMNWDANEEYSPLLLNDYSNHKEQSRVIKSNYGGSISIHTVVKQYAVSAIKKYVREYGKSVTKAKKIKDPVKLQKPVKAKKVKTEKVYTQAQLNHALKSNDLKWEKRLEEVNYKHDKETKVIREQRDKACAKLKVRAMADLLFIEEIERQQQSTED